MNRLCSARAAPHPGHGPLLCTAAPRRCLTMVNSSKTFDHARHQMDSRASRRVDRALARRGLPGEARSSLEIDNRRRAAIQKAESCWRAAMRSHARLGQRRKAMRRRWRRLLAEIARLKTEIPELESEERKLSQQLTTHSRSSRMCRSRRPGRNGCETAMLSVIKSARKKHCFELASFRLGEALGHGLPDGRGSFRRARFVV